MGNRLKSFFISDRPILLYNAVLSTPLNYLANFQFSRSNWLNLLILNCSIIDLIIIRISFISKKLIMSYKPQTLYMSTFCAFVSQIAFVCENERF